MLTGCWKQSDVVSIKSDGSTSFKSDVVITEKGFSAKDIEEISSEFMRTLTSAGWKVEKRWISKSEPFRLSLSGQANIRHVKSAGDFYTIEKLTDNSYRIRFIPAQAQGGKSSRSIKFERGFFGGECEGPGRRG